MNRSSRLLFIGAATLLSSGGLLADTAPIPFAEATITEVVNDVQIVGTDTKSRKAAKADKFLAPELVKTGRKSRAQLTAPDGSIARVGSNAVFSFDKSTRSMNLQRGSVLFHSPTGKGGGTVVTNSATASVIGTTIMVTATSDGGFKLLVLEGVAKVTLGGVASELKPGQMTFVLPSKGGDQPKLGPVLNFDLEALTKESSLVGGFDSPLASISKIQTAIAEQGLKIEDGDLRKTGLFILGAGEDGGFQVTDAASLQQSISLSLQQSISLSEQQRVAQALATSVVFDGNPASIPPTNIFLNPVLVPLGLLPAGTSFPQGELTNVVGVLAGHLELNTSVFDLGFLDSGAAGDVLTLAGFQAGSLVIPGNITFSGLVKHHYLQVIGGQLDIAPGSNVDVVFSNTDGKQVGARFISLLGLSLDSVNFSNTTGALALAAFGGDLVLDNVSVSTGTRTLTENVAANAMYAPSVMPSGCDISLHSATGTVILTGGSYDATGNIKVESPVSVSLDGASLNAYESIRIDGASNVSLSNNAYISGTNVDINGASITIDSSQVYSSLLFIERSPGVLASNITIKNSTLSAYGTNGVEAPIQLRADTIVIDGVDFSYAATLRVQTGRMAANFDGSNGLEAGKANLVNTTYAGGTGAQIWVPKDNIGDVSAGIHVLDASTPDFRGTKLEFSLERPLTLDASSTFTPNSNCFFDADNLQPATDLGQTGGDLVTYSELGFASDPGLPSVFYAGENSHSAYQVHGVFAKDMTLNGATVDLSAFAVPSGSTFGEHADVVAKNMNISGTVTLVANSVPAGLELPGTVEVRGINLNFAAGSSLIFGAAPDSSRGSNELLLVSGTSLTLNNVTLRNDSGNFDVRVFGDLMLNGGIVSAGGVDALLNPVSGDVVLRAANSVTVSGNASLAGTSDVNITASSGPLSVASGVTMTAGNYDFQAGQLLESGQVYMNANSGVISVVSAGVQAYGENVSSTGSINFYSQSVNLQNAGLMVIDKAATAAAAQQSAPPVYSGYIGIVASATVTIDGGYLKASDISISATDTQAGVVNLKNNPLFAGLNASPDGSNRGISVEARTVNIADVNFPSNAEIRLRSGDGVLNLGTSLVGAVNFIKGVAYNGASLVDASGAVGAAEVSNLNSLVWVQGSTAGSLIKVNGAAQTGQGVTGNASSTSAPIHVQAVGAASAPGIHNNL